MNTNKTKTNIMFVLVFTLAIVNGQTLGGKAILTGTWNGQEIEYIDGQILVGLEQGSPRSSVDNLFLQENLTVVKDFDRLNIALLETESGADLFEKINTLNNSSNISFAEPNGVIHTSDYPNDPYYEGSSPATYTHHWAYRKTAISN